MSGFKVANLQTGTIWTRCDNYVDLINEGQAGSEVLKLSSIPGSCKVVRYAVHSLAFGTTRKIICELLSDDSNVFWYPQNL